MIMEETILDSLYNPTDLEPIIESLNLLVQEFIKTRVYTEWLLGLTVAIFALLIIIVFSIFISNYK